MTQVTKLVCLLLCVAGASSYAQDFHVTLKNNTFEPAIIEVPAGKKVRLVIFNQDDDAEEFDSFDLNREKLLFPNRKAIIYIGPLKPGSYEYFGEFNPNTARGEVKAVRQSKSQGSEQND